MLAGKTRTLSNAKRGMKTPPRVLATNSRAVTPGRSNKSSLPDNVNALLVLDLGTQAPLPKRDEEEKYTAKDCTLIPRQQYRGFHIKKVRHRFYYLRSLRFHHNKTEWKELVKWALNYAKDHPEEVNSEESKSTMTSEYLYHVCFRVNPFTNVSRFFL
jgi:hypothetical protein